MWIYLGCFFSSILLLYLSNKVKYKIHKRAITLLALLLPCILAGVRALEIGTDVKVYVSPMFNNAVYSSSFINYLNSKIQITRCVKDFEPGFYLLVYSIGHYFNNIHLLLFIIEVLIIFPLYLGIKKIGSLENQMWYVMLIYYFQFYNQGLNAMRQFIAISICIYGICSILSKEKKGLLKYLISLVIAFSFHKSALISLSLVLIYYILNQKKENKKCIKYKDFKMPISVLISVIIIIFGFYLIFNMQILSDFLYGIDGLERYAMYSKNSLTIFDLNIIKVLPMLIILVFSLKQFYKKYEDCLFYVITFCFAYLMFGQLINVSKYGSRISLLYSNFSCITYPLISQCSDYAKNRRIIKVITFMYVLFMWWYSYVYKGYQQTVPFVFGF